MPTVTQILCDIGQTTQFKAERMKEVAEVVTLGYAEPHADGYRLTKKGERLSTERSAGLNEA